MTVLDFNSLELLTGQEVLHVGNMSKGDKFGAYTICIIWCQFLSKCLSKCQQFIINNSFFSLPQNEQNTLVDFPGGQNIKFTHGYTFLYFEFL